DVALRDRIVAHALEHLEGVTVLAAVLVDGHGTLSIGVPPGPGTAPSGRAPRLVVRRGRGCQVVEQGHPHRLPDEPGGDVACCTKRDRDHRDQPTSAKGCRHIRKFGISDNYVLA